MREPLNQEVSGESGYRTSDLRGLQEAGEDPGEVLRTLETPPLATVTLYGLSGSRTR